jgi:hypothetical protein
MKHLNKLVVALVLFLGLNAQAQDSNNPWAISFGTNAVDTRVSAASKIQDQFSQYFNVKDYWNVLPSVSYVTVSKSVGGNFTFGVTGSINKITRFVETRTQVPGPYTVTNPGDLSYYSADGTIRYSFMEMLGWKVLEPSAHLGGGYTSFGDASYGTFNGGFGYWKFWYLSPFTFSIVETTEFNFIQINQFHIFIIFSYQMIIN